MIDVFFILPSLYGCHNLVMNRSIIHAKLPEPHPEPILTNK